MDFMQVHVGSSVIWKSILVWKRLLLFPWGALLYGLAAIAAVLLRFLAVAGVQPTKALDRVKVGLAVAGGLVGPTAAAHRFQLRKTEI